MLKSKLKQILCILLCLSLLLPTSMVGQATGFEYDKDFKNPYYDQEPSAVGTGAAAATEHPLATQAAIDIMKQGGNAVDAAIAAHAVQNLVRPFAGGVGGGGMMNIYLADKNEVVTLTHRSLSPAAFNIESFEDEDGNVIPQLTRLSSGMSVAVPGSVKAWEEALEKYGNLTFKEVLAPAIKHAKEGFIADDDIIREISENAYRLRIYESSRKIYLTEDGKVPKPGTVIKNPDLARTFELISEHGSEVFYYGEIGEAIVNAVNNPPFVENYKAEWRQDLPLPIPGRMSMDDFAAYTVVTGKPVTTTYRGYTYYGMPLVSSGGTMIGQLLNILEGYDLSSMSMTEFYHHFMEASRFVFADYRAYHGDPEHVDVPVDGMLSKKYAEQLRQKIGERAVIGEVPPGDAWTYQNNPNYTPPSRPSEPGFTYDFVGDEGDAWDKEKFFVSSSYDTSYTLDGNGFGRMEVGARRNTAGRAVSEMIWTENSELLVPFRIDGFGGDRRLRLWLRADGFNLTSSPYNGYAVEIKSGADEIQLIKRVDGSGPIVAKFNRQRTSDLQWLRFKVVDDQISIKVWNDGEDEPERWNLVHEDNSVTGPGRLLISTVEITGATEGGAFELGEIVVKETDERTETDIHLEPGFSYDFAGNAGDPWDSNKFSTLNTRDATMTLTGDGSGRINLPVNTAYGTAIADMNQAKNKELVIPFQFTNVDENSDISLRFWLRADNVTGTVSPNNGYGVDIRPTRAKESQIRLVKAIDNSNTYLQNLGEINEDEHMLRFKVVDNQISVKVWNKNDVEPSKWTYVTEDNSLDRPGRLMIGAYEFGQNTAGSAGVIIGEINVEETDERTEIDVPVDPVDPIYDFEPRFFYEFIGNEGDPWDADKFTVETRNSTVSESVYGFGRIELGENRNDYARITPNMLPAENMELLTSYKIDDIGNSRTLRFWLRADEWAGNTYPRNGYSIEIKSGFDSIRIHKALNQTSGSPGEVARFDYESTNEEQMLRARIIGSQLFVKVWDASKDEPDNWTYVYVDNSNPIQGEGVFLLSAFENTAGQGGSFSVGKMQVNALVELESANDSEEIENEGETINVTIADQYGNVVAHTSTITSVAGSGIVVPGYGFMLNNVLGNRTRLMADEGEPNAAAELMRPLSTMSPTIIMKDGKPVFAGGAPGGLTIPTTVSQVILLHLDRGMSLPEAVEMPRISQENRTHGRTYIEKWFTDFPEYEELEALGHKFDISTLTHGIGSFNGIAFLPDGQKEAVAEAVRRGGGSAMVEDIPPIVPGPTDPKDPDRGSGSRGGSGGSSDTSLETSNSAVITANGRTVSINGATISIPAQAFGSDFTITVTKLDNTSGLTIPANISLIGDVFEITKDKSGNFHAAVTITLPFDRSKVDLDDYDIAIFWYDEETEEWVALDNVKVNTSANKVSGDIDHFTKFAVLAVEKEAMTEEKEEEHELEQTPIHLTDIQGHWAKANIEALVDIGAINGYPNGTFLANNSITRAEFATVLVKAFGLESTQGTIFTDTADHWAQEYIATAAAHGIVTGYNETTFGADDLITREQMAAMMVRATQLETGENGTTFSDHAQISNWAVDAIQIAAQANLITGYPDHSFQPQGNATRAEAVTVIARALNN